MMEIPKPGEDKDFDELMKRFLAKLAKSMDDGMPESDCPEDFDRAIKITDDDALLHLARIQNIKTEGESIFGRLRALKWQAQLAGYELFERLKKTYPAVGSPPRGMTEETAGTGYRYWKGEVWYVGHDVRRKDKDGKTEDERGGQPKALPEGGEPSSR